MFVLAASHSQLLEETHLPNRTLRTEPKICAGSFAAPNLSPKVVACDGASEEMYEWPGCVASLLFIHQVQPGCGFVILVLQIGFDTSNI
jgi:hypothetical protein